jgi:glycerophosphoryl diester phosphodiesterase
MHNVDPQVRLSYLYNDDYTDDMVLSDVRPYAYGVAIIAEFLHIEYVKYCNDRNIKVSVWYGKHQEDMQRDPAVFHLLSNWGVDCFITDYVELFTHLRDNEYNDIPFINLE